MVRQECRQQERRHNIRVAIIENELVGSKSDIYRVAQLSVSDIANQYYDAKKFLQLSNNQDTLTYNYPSSSKPSRGEWKNIS